MFFFQYRGVYLQFVQNVSALQLSGWSQIHRYTPMFSLLRPLPVQFVRFRVCVARRLKKKKKNGLGWVLRRPGDPLHMPEKGCFNMFQYGFVEVLYICQWAATVETSRNNYLHLGFCVEPQPNSESIHLVGFLSTLLVDSSQARPRCGANHRCSPGTLAVVPMGFAYGMIGGIRILTNMPEPSYPDAPFAMYGRRYRQKYDIFLAIPADPS